MREIVKYVDIMKISDEETELLTGVKDYKEASQILIDKGVKIVVVTLGKDGAFVRTATDGRYVKGYKAKAVDMTGAGDSFWGGFYINFAEVVKALMKSPLMRQHSLLILEMQLQVYV